MNRARHSPLCLVCGMDIQARLRACDLVRLRAEFARMMTNGICDDCQSDRMEAAQEYENAVAQVRLVAAMGGRWSNARPPVIHPALAEAVQRRNAADAWCMRLKMWPADRPVREETKCPSPFRRVS